MASTGGYPHADVTGRMAVFGRLFGEQVGIAEVEALQTPEDLVEVVRERLPRTGEATEELPVFEAAAYMGEWLRARTHATWVAEGPYEPHLQVLDDRHAIVYLVPLINLLRTASTAGYDGVPELMHTVLHDTGKPTKRVPLPRLRVEPPTEREAVVWWIRRNRHVRDAMRAALWRRCAFCARKREDMVTLQHQGHDWERESATAASILARRPFECPCGGVPGQATRFLMLRSVGGVLRFGDIVVTGSFTRVGCWTLEGEDVEPFDALSLAGEEMAG